MGKRKLKVWYDADADLFQVYFERKPGYYAPTNDERVEVRLDTEGNVIGFNLLGAKSAKGKPIDVELAPRDQEKIQEPVNNDD